MTDHDTLTPEQRVRAVELVRNTAALNLDEMPPEMKIIIADARRLLSDAGLGVHCPDDDTPRRSDATGR